MVWTFDGEYVSYFQYIFSTISWTGTEEQAFDKRLPSFLKEARSVEEYKSDCLRVVGELVGCIRSISFSENFEIKRWRGLNEYSFACELQSGDHWSEYATLGDGDKEAVAKERWI